MLESPRLVSDRSNPATPGDLYVFTIAMDAAVEWLVVQEHPDDSDHLLMVPADDFPLAGTSNVVLPHDLVGRPLTARCGCSLCCRGAVRTSASRRCRA